MSFNLGSGQQQQQQQQPKQQTVQVAAPAPAPAQSKTTTVIRKTTTTTQQQQPAVQKVTREERTRLQQEARQQQQSVPVQQKEYSSGPFGHIKDNVDQQRRLDAAVASMSLRSARAGDQFDVERRLEKRYEEEEKLGTPNRIIDWISRALHGQIPPPNGIEWKQVQLYLKDGVILCKLMNKLLKHAGMEPVGYRQKATMAFVAINNLDTFMMGAKRYGVPNSSLFQPADLYEGRKGQLTNVLHCLNALGCVANARGFQPPYEEPAPPKADWCKDECYD